MNYFFDMVVSINLDGFIFIDDFLINGKFLLDF